MSSPFYESVKPFDVDGTLIINYRRDDESFTFKDPITGTDELASPHWPMINLLKKYKDEGHTIVVWSRSGGEYAHNVLVALGIRDKVDIVMEKPFDYFDDEECGYKKDGTGPGWMGPRIWLKN